MKTTVYDVEASFRLNDGRVLECRYRYAEDEACDDCPAYGEPSEDFEFYLDGERVELEALPKGLQAIADRLCEPTLFQGKGFAITMREVRDGQRH